MVILITQLVTHHHQEALNPLLLHLYYTNVIKSKFRVKNLNLLMFVPKIDKRNETQSNYGGYSVINFQGH